MAGARRVLFANSIYHLTNDGAVTVIAGQITILQTQFAFGALETGLLSGTALLITALFQIVFGAMSDHRDPTRFLPFGVVILGVGSMLVAASSNFWMLLVLVSLSRIGASFYHPVGISWIGREFKGPELDRAMGFQSAFGDTGVILGMATTSIVAFALGWRWPFLLWGGINLGAAAVASWLVRRDRAPPSPTGLKPDYVQMIRDVKLWIFPLALGGAAFSIFSTFGPPLLHHRFGFDDITSALGIDGSGDIAPWSPVTRSSGSRASWGSPPGASASPSPCSGRLAPRSSSPIRHSSRSWPRRAIGASRAPRSASSSASSCSADPWAPSRRAVSRPPSGRSETWSPPLPFTCSGSSPSRGSRT